MQKIIAVRLTNKQENSVKFQDVLSNYGEIVKFRVGMSYSEHRGMIMLYVESSDEVMCNLIKDLEDVEGLSMNSMEAPCMMCD